jgi:predicted transcriptional regulator
LPNTRQMTRFETDPVYDQLMFRWRDAIDLLFSARRLGEFLAAVRVAQSLWPIIEDTDLQDDNGLALSETGVWRALAPLAEREQTLLALLAAGPCTIQGLASALALPPADVKLGVYYLSAMGCVERTTGTGVGAGIRWLGSGIRPGSVRQAMEAMRQPN